MSRFLILVAFAVTACGGSKSAPTEPTPVAAPPAEALSPEECTTKGGEVRGDIGDGKIACADGEQDLGRVRQGIEGAVCCLKVPAN